MSVINKNLLHQYLQELDKKYDLDSNNIRSFIYDTIDIINSVNSFYWDVDSVENMSFYYYNFILENKYGFDNKINSFNKCLCIYFSYMFHLFQIFGIRNIEKHWTTQDCKLIYKILPPIIKKVINIITTKKNQYQLVLLLMKCINFNHHIDRNYIKLYAEQFKIIKLTDYNFTIPKFDEEGTLIVI